jgi:hypothetical protein
MMRLVALPCLFGVAAVPGPALAEFAFGPGELAVRMNGIAAELKLPNQYEKDRCEMGTDGTTCWYAGKSVTLIATADAQSRSARNVRVSFTFAGDNSDIFSAITTWGIVMATVDPSLSKDDRGDIFSKLIPAVVNETTQSEVRGAARYSLTVSNIVGIWFNAEALN